MKQELLNLIKDYKANIERVLRLMENKFGKVNFPLAKSKGLIPKTGFLDEEQRIKYNFHGMGLMVDFGDEIVDFDFHLGFNVWWLRYYLDYHKQKYSNLVDLDTNHLQSLLNQLEEEGVIKFDKNLQVYHLENEQNKRTYGNQQKT